MLPALLDFVDVLLHPVGACPLHRVSDMPVDIQSERCRGVAQVALYGLDIISRPDGSNGERVPLWHNKDKSENLVFARSFRFVPILFPLKKPSKWGCQEGGEKARLHISDKFLRRCRRGLWAKVEPPSAKIS